MYSMATINTINWTQNVHSVGSAFFLRVLSIIHSILSCTRWTKFTFHGLFFCMCLFHRQDWTRHWGSISQLIDWLTFASAFRNKYIWNIQSTQYCTVRPPCFCVSGAVYPQFYLLLWLILLVAFPSSSSSSLPSSSRTWYIRICIDDSVRFFTFHPSMMIYYELVCDSFQCSSITYSYSPPASPINFNFIIINNNCWHGKIFCDYSVKTETLHIRSDTCQNIWADFLEFWKPEMSEW